MTLADLPVKATFTATGFAGSLVKCTSNHFTPEPGFSIVWCAADGNVITLADTSAVTPAPPVCAPIG